MAGDRILTRRSCQVGDVIFKQGQGGDVAYVVQEGEVRIEVGEGDKRVVVGTVGKGGIFGEMALISAMPRTATARASKASTLIVISPALLEQKLAKADPFVKGLLNIFAGHIQRMNEAAGGAGPPAKNAAPVPEAAADAATGAPSEGINERVLAKPSEQSGA